MTLEQEVRDFAEKCIPNGDYYLREVPVTGFSGLTWEQVFAGQGPVKEETQRRVLKTLKNIWGEKHLPPR